MSQKVRINGVKHAGASVFLGVDHCGNPRWTRNPERVMVWLCDGWRTRFNQRREQRPRNVPVKDDATGEVVDWLKEPLGGPDVAELLPDKEARLQCSWMAGIPASILSSTDRIEGVEWVRRTQTEEDRRRPRSRLQVAPSRPGLRLLAQRLQDWQRDLPENRS